MHEVVMQMELHILGTASARPASRRNVSGSLMSCEDGIAVIDAGEGFQTRYAEHRKRLKSQKPPSSLKAAKIDVVCLTHGHLDHTWGLLPWLQTMALDRRTNPLLIIGPTSAETLAALIGGQSIPDAAPPAELARQMQSWHSLGATSQGLGYEVRWILGDVQSDSWIELNPDTGEASPLSVMPQPKGWKQVRLVPLSTEHSVPSCAWMFESKEKSGKFNRMKAAEFRLTTEQQTELGQGRDVSLPDGTLLEASSFRGASIRPRRVVVSGDTAEQAPGIVALDGVDLLVHEATFLEDTQDHATEHLHSTATGAVRTALACGAKHLVLTHFSARIKDGSVPLAEANGIIDGAQLDITLAHDGDRVLLHDNGDVSHHTWSGKDWAA